MKVKIPGSRGSCEGVSSKTLEACSVSERDSTWYVPLCGLRATNVHLITRPGAVRDSAVGILLPDPVDLCGEQEKHDHSARSRSSAV